MRRVWIGALAVVMAVAGTTVLVAANDSDEEPQREVHVLPHGWQFNRDPFSASTGRLSPTEIARRVRRIPIQVDTGYCVGEGKPKLEHVEVRETARAVEVTAYIAKPEIEHPEVPDDFSIACAGVGYILFGSIVLDRRLGGRRLIDAGTDPPRIRRLRE